jgi:hypothetical protein
MMPHNVLGHYVELCFFYPNVELCYPYTFHFLLARLELVLILVVKDATIIFMKLMFSVQTPKLF